MTQPLNFAASADKDRKQKAKGKSKRGYPLTELEYPVGSCFLHSMFLVSSAGDMFLSLIHGVYEKTKLFFNITTYLMKYLSILGYG